MLDWLQLSRYQKEKIFDFEDRQKEELIREFDKQLSKDEKPYNYHKEQYFIRRSAELARR